MKTKKALQSLFLLACLGLNLILGPKPGVLAAPQAELRVCSSGCTYTSVQAAVDAASPGDEIKIATGTYTGVSSPNGVAQMVYITQSLTLRGGYNADFSVQDPEVYPTILNAEAQGRVFYIDGSAEPELINVTLEGLQITGGSWGTSEYVGYNDSTNLSNSWWRAALGGGMRVRKTNLTLNRCVLKNNHTPNGVGSGLFQHYGSFSMQNSTVESNGGTGTNFPFLGNVGGGLFFLQVTVNIDYSTIQNNSAGHGYSNLSSEANGGGLYLNHSTAAIQHTTFQGNEASRNDYGRGGAIYSSFSSLTLSDSTILNNKSCEVHQYCVGGGVYGDTTTILNANRFEGNQDGAMYVTNAMTITGNTIVNNTGGVSSAVTIAGGATLNGSGTFENNTLTSNTSPGGGGASFSGSLTASGNVFDGNTSTGNGGGLITYDTVTLIRNQFKNNTAAGCGGGLYSYKLSLENGDLFKNNTAMNGGGLCIKANVSSTQYKNLVILNNQGTANGSGIYVDRGSTSGTVNLYHLTLSGNTGGDGAGVTVNTGRVSFSNTIIANQNVGVQNIGGTPSFDHTLRYQVTTPIVGSVSDLYAYTGDPAFDTDGYHLTQTSNAIDAGVTTTTTDDVDGGTRPIGQAPDLGADESPYTPNVPEGVSASQLVGTPRWVMQWDAANNTTRLILQQDYLIRFGYGGSSSAPAISSYSVKDTFPGALQLASKDSSPSMNYSRSNNQLTWASTGPLQPGSSGWVSILGQSTSLTPGTTLNNTGQFEYSLNNIQTYSIPFQGSSQVPDKPLKPPFLTSPMNGEMCLNEDKQLEASGLTSPGMAVKLYENEAYIATATADAAGKFTFTWTSALSDTNPINVYVVACDPASPSTCSAPSRSVHLTFPQAFWCPQRSYWEGNVGSAHFLFHFVNQLGMYATNDFMIAGVHGFQGTQLHLYSCCDRDTNPFLVKADGITYPATGHEGRMWNFTIGSAHDVTVQSQCQVGGNNPSHGTVLIDPDGFVFDSTLGGKYDAVTGMFAPNQALQGATVTAYVYVPEWESWVVWPASQYEHQVNPQVTGADGYFAFFTPPGKYYLEATGLASFQTWRSPVIEVVSEIVHANIPLTPKISLPVTQVVLTPDGPNPSSVHIAPGGYIEWLSSAGSAPTLSEIASLKANPIQRVLSSLDPLINVLGFDGGRLAPGEVFKRQFTQAGTYSYADGAGHTGKVIVGSGGSSVFLPVITR